MKKLRLLITIIIISSFSCCTSGQNQNVPILVEENFQVPNKWKESKISGKKAKIFCPQDWELGNPNHQTMNEYWIGIPNFEAKGNVVLTILPWNYPIDFSNINSIDYKKELLIANFYYSDLIFENFDTNFKIDGKPALFTYFIGQGKFVNKEYQEIIFQVLNDNNLFTIKAQFENPPKLTSQQIQLLKDVARSIKFDD